MSPSVPRGQWLQKTDADDLNPKKNEPGGLKLLTNDFLAKFCYRNPACNRNDPLSIRAFYPANPGLLFLFLRCKWRAKQGPRSFRDYGWIIPEYIPWPVKAIGFV